MDPLGRGLTLTVTLTPEPPHPLAPPEIRYVTLSWAVPLFVSVCEIVVPAKLVPLLNPLILPDEGVAVQLYVVPPTLLASPIEVADPLQMVGRLFVGVTVGLGFTTTVVLPEVRLVQPLLVTVAV
jgi:hypothetical protein